MLLPYKQPHQKMLKIPSHIKVTPVHQELATGKPGETIELHDNYRVVFCAYEDVRKVVDTYYKDVFSHDWNIRIQDFYSDQEKENVLKLNTNLEKLCRLQAMVCKQDTIIGWFFGHQLGPNNPASFYMVNGGLLPAYQNKKIAQQFVKTLLEILNRKGFQIVTSKHKATNNKAIVPLLKLGFVISGFEISDQFGLHVQLTYFFNNKRRELMDVRCGMQRCHEKFDKNVYP